MHFWKLEFQQDLRTTLIFPEDAEPITIKHVDVDHPEPSVHLNDVSMIMDKEYGKMTETYFHGYTPGFRINVTIKMSFVTHIKLYAAYFLEYYGKNPHTFFYDFQLLLKFSTD